MHRYIQPFEVHRKKAPVVAVEVQDRSMNGYMGVAFADGTWTAVEFRRDDGFHHIGGLTEGFNVSARAMSHVVAGLGLIAKYEADEFDNELWKRDQEYLRESRVIAAKYTLEQNGYKVIPPEKKP